MYSKITNPETGRKVNLLGKTGQQILRNYIHLMNGGAPECSQIYQACKMPGPLGKSNCCEGTSCHTMKHMEKNGKTYEVYTPLLVRNGSLPGTKGFCWNPEAPNKVDRIEATNHRLMLDYNTYLSKMLDDNYMGEKIHGIPFKYGENVKNLRSIRLGTHPVLRVGSPGKVTGANGGLVKVVFNQSNQDIWPPMEYQMNPEDLAKSRDFVS